MDDPSKDLNDKIQDQWMEIWRLIHGSRAITNQACLNPDANKNGCQCIGATLSPDQASAPMQAKKKRLSAKIVHNVFRFVKKWEELLNVISNAECVNRICNLHLSDPSAFSMLHQAGRITKGSLI